MMPSLEKKNNFDIGLIFFKTSIILLPSFFIFSSFFLTLSLIIRVFETNFKDIVREKFNYPLYATGFLMIISCLSSNDLLKNLDLYDIPREIYINWSPFLAWIDLLNWIPMFLIFIYFQKYLSTTKDRKNIGILFIIGSIPVLISGLAQTWFGIYGPFSFLNGLIIWYQRPTSEFSAMFSNQNYAGAWLNIIWPFIFVLILKNNFNKTIKLFTISFGVLITLATYQTFSRNAGIGYIISTLLLTEKKYWIVLIFFLFLLLIPIILSNLNINYHIQNFFKSIIPSKFWSLNNISLTSLVNLPRVNIWLTSLNFISKRPFLGWGASSFPILYEYENNIVKYHSHNLYISLAFNYGIPVSILLTIFFLMLFKRAFTKFKQKRENQKKQNNLLLFDKAWLVSIFTLMISQLFDIQYFEGRISIAMWILLAGLRRF